MRRGFMVVAVVAVAVLTACGGSSPRQVGASSPADVSASAEAPSSADASAAAPVPEPASAAPSPLGRVLSAAEARRLLGAQAAADPDVGSLVWSQDAAHVLHTEVPGERAETLWWRLRDLVGTTRRWPVVRGATDEQVPPDAAPDVAAVLARAETFDRTTWLAARARENDLVTGPMARDAVASGPRFTGHDFFSARDSVSGSFLTSVDLALVPDPRPWAAAAYLGFGGWNDCPEPAVHVALMHDWYTRWGAEPFALVDGVQAEMWVPRPPRTIDEAMPLGQVQYVYAYDDVLQGSADITTREAYAGALIGYQSWQFWWD